MGVAQDLHGKHPDPQQHGHVHVSSSYGRRCDQPPGDRLAQASGSDDEGMPCEQQLSAQRLLRRIKFGAPGHHQGTPVDVSPQDGLGGQDCKGRGEQPGTDVEPLTNALPL